MPIKKLFEAVNRNINKYEIRLENYGIPSIQTSKSSKIPEPEENESARSPKVNLSSVKHSVINVKDKAKEHTKRDSKYDGNMQLNGDNNGENLEETTKYEIAKKYAAFADTHVTSQPKLCMWLYMSKADVEELLKLASKQIIKNNIDKKMKSEYPKGISRLLAVELLYSVVQYCQKNKLSIIQSGTLLSIFYLTHEHFLGSLHATAEETYGFFKEYMLLHCFESPPDSMEIFNYKQSTHIVRYFCILYLQNLPLIRLLTLPNFAFHLNYEKQHDPFEDMVKKGKPEKGKKKK